MKYYSNPCRNISYKTFYIRFVFWFSDMGYNPCLLFSLINASAQTYRLQNITPTNIYALVRIPVSECISHHADKYIGFVDLTSIRINDCCRISCPIDLNLLTRFPVDMHGSTSFLFILLDVVTELRIHKWFFVIQTTFFHIFRLQEFLGHSISEQLLMDVVKVWHSL